MADRKVQSSHSRNLATKARKTTHGSKGNARRPNVAKTVGKRSASKASRRKSQDKRRVSARRQGAALSSDSAYASVRFLLPIAVALIACVALAAFAFSTCSKREIPEGPALPAYITDDLLDTALDMQDEYGHPAGCTIAQIIQESGAGDTPSALALRDHNLFGMKWSDYYDGMPGVVGPAEWDTDEEYDGQTVTISGTFIAFTDDVACITFRSSVFLQAERYRTNPLIQEAIQTGSSVTMAQGLYDAGWATDSSYTESLIALMDEYDLYRFDKQN